MPKQSKNPDRSQDDREPQRRDRTPDHRERIESGDQDDTQRVGMPAPDMEGEDTEEASRADEQRDEEEDIEREAERGDLK